MQVRAVNYLRWERDLLSLESYGGWGRQPGRDLDDDRAAAGAALPTGIGMFVKSIGVRLPYYADTVV